MSTIVSFCFYTQGLEEVITIGALTNKLHVVSSIREVGSAVNIFVKKLTEAEHREYSAKTPQALTAKDICSLASEEQLYKVYNGVPYSIQYRLK